MITFIVLFWVSIGIMALGLIFPGLLWRNPQVPVNQKRWLITGIAFVFACIFLILYYSLT